MSSLFAAPKRALILIQIIFVLISAQLAAALTIDKFDGDQVAEARGPGNVAYSLQNSPSAVGGTRAMRTEIDLASNPGTLRLRTIFGWASHSQDALVVGNSLLTWDGDSDVSNLNSTGLGGIDFTQDGGDALRLHVISFDFPNAQPVELTFTLYDSSDPTGETYSSAPLILSQTVSNQIFDIPFANFINDGPGGGVDFTSVGAVTLLVDGKVSDVDLTFEWIGTNGECDTLVPDQNGRVIDECGVCGGDDSSCADCEGVPNGSALPGTSCTSDSPGICADGEYSQQCACESIVEPQDEVCDGVDNDCDGEVDESFPNLGEVCVIGDGLCRSEGSYTCSDSKQLMCDAVVITSPECDLPKGCDGVPGSGLSPDACGVCGGDGTSCLDCNGVPGGKAKVDRCGICGGDGLSCLDCSVTNIESLLRQLDGGAKNQLRLIKRSVKRLRKLKPKKSYRKQARLIVKEGTQLKNENWTLSWSVDKESISCGPSVSICVSTSTLPVLSQYRQNSERLRDLGMEVLRMYYELTERELRRLSKRHDRRHEKNMLLAEQVPAQQYKCDFTN